MKTFRLVIVLVLAGCAVGAVVRIFVPMLGERSDRARKLAEIKAENDRSEREIAEIRRRRNEFETNPEYVEYTARREGRAKPGETVFDFGNPSEGTQPQP